MKNDIVKIRINNELDIVLAYKRAKQLAEFTGMNISNQTKFGTAVSEICRNVLEHVGEGFISFNITDQGRMFLEAVITDNGRGFSNANDFLSRKSSNFSNKGHGLQNAKKLSDDFYLESSAEKGTKVIIRKKIAFNHPPINNMIIKGWTDYFQNEMAVSPYEEIKKQNMEFIEVVETLRVKNIEAEDQIQEIKRLNNELDKFAYIVSHDLKAPLKNIQGLINMINDSIENPNEETQAGIEMLHGQTARMDKLITDILSYSKAGKLNVPKNLVNVKMLIEEIWKQLKRNSNIEIHLSENLPVLFTEEVFLNQILSNLIGNAVKYHNKENGNVWIDVTNGQADFVTFMVEDDGPGISERDQNRIFKIFESVTPGKSDSTGVGLSIVQNIVTQKGGRVWVESDGKNGSRFIFTWPDKE